MPGWVPGPSGTSGTPLGPALQARSKDRKGKAQKEPPLLVPSMVPPQLETLGVGVTCPCWWTAELGQPSCSAWAPRRPLELRSRGTSPQTPSPAPLSPRLPPRSSMPGSARPRPGSDTQRLQELRASNQKPVCSCLAPVTRGCRRLPGPVPAGDVEAGSV